MRYESKKQKIFSFLKYVILSFFSFPRSVYCPSVHMLTLWHVEYIGPGKCCCRVRESLRSRLHFPLISVRKQGTCFRWSESQCEQPAARAGGKRGLCALYLGGALPLLTSPNWLHPLKRLGIPWNTAKGFPALNAMQFSTCCGGGMALASSPKQGISFPESLLFASGP